MSGIKKINHVAIVVENIDDALSFWQDSMGMKLDHIEDVPSQKSTVAFLPIGDSELELVSPTSEDSGMAKYLQNRGAGIHHLCIEVAGIEEMIANLKEKGVRLINENS